MNPSTLERLYSHIVDYERTISDLAFRLGSVSQDISYLKNELQDLVDQERYYNGI